MAKGSTPSAQRSIFINASELLKQTLQEWLQDKAPQLGAALADNILFFWRNAWLCGFLRCVTP